MTRNQTSRTSNTQRKPAHKKRKPRQNNKKKSFFIRLGIKLGLVGLVVFAGFVIYLNAKVQTKFSGKRWIVPAKVYARPLELFAGKSLTKTDFLQEMNALGYSQASQAARPGKIAVNGNTVDLYSRKFHFYEGSEPAKAMRLQFSATKIASLTTPNGKALPIARIEPLLMGALYPSQKEDRVLITLDQASAFLAPTLVAVEDRDFYSHFGISIKSILRAVWVNLISGSVKQGGSTLTQQLVKNFYLSNERSLARKGTEAIMAVLLELHYSKQEILGAYINEVFLGQDGNRAIHGFGLASQYFFGRPLSELTLDQAALLVGMVKGPTYYNPRRHPERALARRNLVLDLLAEQKLITPERAKLSKARALGVKRKGSFVSSSYPAFFDLVKRQLRHDYKKEDLEDEGLRIFTSFDPVLQSKAEKSVSNTFKKFSVYKNSDKLDTGMVVANPSTGEIQALIGSRRPHYAGFNRALDAVRPIGSLVKPAIYLTALSQPKRYTLTSLLKDQYFSVKTQDGQIWRPQNYDRKAHGTIFLNQGLIHSYNLSSARLGLQLGIGNVFKTIERMGVKVNWPAFPSMLLGAGALSPIEVATMYQTIARGGFYTPMRSIRSVLDSNGTPLKRYPYKTQQRFDSGAVYLLQKTMQKVMREGTGRSAYNQVPRSVNLAGKTGTSNDLRDSWFAGFGSDLLAVVWVGRDDNGATALTGASGALQVWSQFMGKAHVHSLKLPVPGNIVRAWVNSKTGKGSNQSCPGAVLMLYVKGSAPIAGGACSKFNSKVDETQLQRIIN
ncbi:UNVERIFIED_CONTAM: hypothetical protein GTU68_006858 [Idotea baltica]|nr:hypothetical protein [Idotea baltica]